LVNVPALCAGASSEQTAQIKLDIQRELDLAARLSQIPGITSMLEAFVEPSGVVHLVMEVCNGPTLQRVLDKRGALSEPETRSIMRQLVEAVVHLHALLIVHRDLKPENVMFKSELPREWRESGGLGDGAVEMIDFGLARTLNGSEGADASSVGASAEFARDALPTPRLDPNEAGGNPNDEGTSGSLYGLFGSNLAASPTDLSASPTELTDGSQHRSLDASKHSTTSSGDDPNSSWHGGASFFDQRSRGRNKEVLFLDMAAEGDNGRTPRTRSSKSAVRGVPPESPGTKLRRRLRLLPATVNMTPVGTKRYAAPELLQCTVSEARPYVALPTSAAPAVDIFSLGQMLRYMLTGLSPGQSYLEYLEKQGTVLPLLKAAVRLARGKGRRPSRVALSPAKLSAPAKELIGQLTSWDATIRPSASSLRDHTWLRPDTALQGNSAPLSTIEGSFRDSSNDGDGDGDDDAPPSKVSPVLSSPLVSAGAPSPA